MKSTRRGNPELAPEGDTSASWTWEAFAPHDVVEVLRAARSHYADPSDQRARDVLHEATKRHLDAEKKRGIERRPGQGRRRGNRGGITGE